ncbi:aspartate/glutamate racemase family protein [Bosea sp. (in: a-proteobacteria)]|uniref:aspartate/glutamate racemase family protein n=1 Tax=Bosea sp. (in: a-proteobacteria) TaxID=1871050 RepID=UPI003B3A846B
MNMIVVPKLLVVNPNTTAAVTERFAMEARRIAGDRAVIEAVTGCFGAGIVTTRAEAVVAAHSALELLARHGAGFDAAILAISFDSGLAAARDVMPIPVIGITGAAMTAAIEHSQRIGLVIFGAESLPLYRDLLQSLRLEDRITGIEVIEIASAGAYLDQASRDAQVFEAITGLASAGAGAVVICGAAVVGIADRLRTEAPLPVFDGAAPAVEAAIAAALATSFSRRAPATLSRSIGLDPHLAALIEGRWPSAPADSPMPTSRSGKE